MIMHVFAVVWIQFSSLVCVRKVYVRVGTFVLRIPLRKLSREREHLLGRSSWEGHSSSSWNEYRHVRATYVLGRGWQHLRRRVRLLLVALGLKRSLPSVDNLPRDTNSLALYIVVLDETAVSCCFYFLFFLNE